MARNKILSGLIIFSSLIIAAGCSAVSASTRKVVGKTASAASVPIPVAVAKRLPPGVFYFQAGVNYISLNIWQMSNTGKEVRLTDNGRNFGISAFGASRAGIVLADAASGSDELARLTANGADFLREGAGSAPYINAAGEISYIISTYGSSGNVTGLDLMVKKSFTAPARLVYRTKAVQMDTTWGPDGSIAVLTQSHYAGTPGPDPKVLIIDKSGKIATVKNDLKEDIGALVWNEQGGGLVIWSDKAEVIYNAKRRYTLPAGWLPGTWNPAGTRLLVQRGGRKLGLWSPSQPHVVKIIGSLPKSPVTGQIYWLAKPARL